jgi:hypothetical protein
VVSLKYQNSVVWATAKQRLVHPSREFCAPLAWVLWVWNKFYICSTTGWDSAFGTEAHYKTDGPGIESRAARFSATVHTVPGAHPTSYTMGIEMKRPGRGVIHPPPTSAKVKERIDLFFCHPYVPSWQVTGWILPFDPLPVSLTWHCGHDLNNVQLMLDFAVIVSRVGHVEYR